ncbi:N-acetylmuramic acid 6-phosphate etherase [Vagococcus fluvialis]|jgi:N-acetylmuramic acid 6-phosphate etherase|uniref:N-acetylmuramic acid 6-phosphate etherase n=3 Tax=Bacilli TaxID=91061 RepID=A0A369B040_9ENTE|nr:N-acetylmuramic acid 6-phosphate etherase [Vagococcus fluvialis]MBO0429443.1 N-acetylmuramic acid 6-phosphate etherase [Vagococcus fluvialis]MBO0479395.1 N-acetylmuramic acid 6-phosphate etherase [Vagococcus fluvialis]MBO0483789.1 N-acetylmuramic acid 6-phosphate etherase [Vagococcus fluvialis]MBO0486399.1 N-acetylmuramic acid 6-phosphate etherase [Vagococcus fluvialis]MCM2139393.1 N-acetylmuramic acid 6-phosphate etherase [Vagococcus fluvialis]
MLENLTTEKRNEDTLNLDKLSIIETVTKMNQEDEKVIAAIEKKKESIAAVIEQVVKSLKNGGRLFYFGAGTSGRLGILDAAECVPTFSTDPELVQGIIAGGESAMTVAVEGAEDSTTLAEEDFRERGLTDKDIVIGISASGRTPYVIGGLKYAAEVGATTASISCNENAEISTFASFPIEVTAGPEILTGSTRLKSGTLQKLILNMISTISMVHLGKVYGNLMVDVKPTNEKLVERAKNIIVEATGCTKEEATHYFEDSDEQVKLAIIRILTKTSKEEGLALLEANDGFIRKAVDNH